MTYKVRWEGQRTARSTPDSVKAVQWVLQMQPWHDNVRLLDELHHAKPGDRFNYGEPPHTRVVVEVSD